MIKSDEKNKWSAPRFLHYPGRGKYTNLDLKNCKRIGDE